MTVEAAHRLEVRPLQIGALKLASNLLLAPIAGYCDVSFRIVARRLGGVGLACTDLLCPQGVLRETFRSMVLAMTCPEDWPLAMQLFGGEGDPLCEAARWAEDHGAAVIDINMGCPVDKVTKRDGGSALLRNPDRTLRMVEGIVRAVRGTPITAKLRLGWDDQSIVAPYLARRLEEVGVAAITIHGRTTAMGFSGKARLEGIAEVAAAVKSIPVIGNGDVNSPEAARRMMEQTGCAGVMIGRAAISAPWLFRDCWEHLNGRLVPLPPSLEEKCAIMREHFGLLERFRGERIAVLEFRQRVTWYGKQMNPCRPLREGMRSINGRADFERVVEEFLDWRRRGGR